MSRAKVWATAAAIAAALMTDGTLGARPREMPERVPAPEIHPRYTLSRFSRWISFGRVGRYTRDMPEIHPR